MATRRGGGGGGPVKQILWYMFVAMVLLAIWRGMPQDGQGIYDYFDALADDVGSFVKGIGDTISNNIPEPSDSPKSGPSGEPTGSPEPSAPASSEPQPEGE